jgi:hypothetical protein
MVVSVSSKAVRGVRGSDTQLLLCGAAGFAVRSRGGGGLRGIFGRVLKCSRREHLSLSVGGHLDLNILS